MQKTGRILAGIGIVWLGFFATAATTRNTENKSTPSFSSPERVDDMYSQIDFGTGQVLDRAVFQKAYRGYLNLKEAGKLNNARPILSVCDFSLSANTRRLWVIDLSARKVLYNTWVAHGQGSGEEFAVRFSNRENSHQSSLGFYVTNDTYTGDNGYSLKLSGMDDGYNSHAYDRSIVMHGADYVCQSFIEGNQRLGRSWGCPAVPVQLAVPIINAIKDSTCLFIYYPDKRYLAASQWLRREPARFEEPRLKPADSAIAVANVSGRDSGMLKDCAGAQNVYQGVTLAGGRPGVSAP